MRLISKSAFLSDFASYGIKLDSRYHPPQNLVFEGNSDLRWSCELPARIKDLPRWISTLVDALHSERKMFLYPRRGAWRSGDSMKNFQTASIFSSFGLSPAGDEVVEADEADRDAVDSLLFLSLVHGGTVSDDIFMIPDHAKAILYADHHEAVHAMFNDSELMKSYLTEIARFA